MKFSAEDKKEFDELRTKFENARGELVQWLRDQHDAGETEFDEKSEKWQEGEKGQEFKEKVDALGEAADSLEDAGDDTLSGLDL